MKSVLLFAALGAIALPVATTFLGHPSEPDPVSIAESVDLNVTVRNPTQVNVTLPAGPTAATLFSARSTWHEGYNDPCSGMFLEFTLVRDGALTDLFGFDDYGSAVGFTMRPPSGDAIYLNLAGSHSFATPLPVAAGTVITSSGCGSASLIGYYD